METLASLLPFLIILLLFMVMVILPNRRRQKATMAMQQALSPGDEVMTTSGFFGVVRAVGEERLTLEIASGVQVEVARLAIGRILRDEPAVTHTSPGPVPGTEG